MLILIGVLLVALGLGIGLRLRQRRISIGGGGTPAVNSFLGLNLIDFQRTNAYGDVPLTDLFQGDDFTYLAPGPVNTTVPAANRDANGWVTSVPADSVDGRIYYIIRYPLTVGDCTMTWTGAFDALSVGGANFSISNITANSATLTFTATIPEPSNANAQISFIPNAANPPKNIQIIPNGRTGTFTPEFKAKIASFVGNGPIRFIKWTPHVEGGYAVTARNTPSSANWRPNDGIPMEIMLQLLSEVGKDGFFNFGVLESDTVINQKLALIDAFLAANPARKVHIQSSNEDWNVIYGQVQYVLQGWASADGLDSPTAGVTISSITRSGTTATVTTSTAHGRSTNDWVKVSGATPSGFNGSYRITVTSTTTFTYTMAADPGGNATVVGSYTYGADIWGGMYKESAKRSNHVMDLVAAAIDPSRMSRVVRELGTWNANPSVTDNLLAYTGTAAHHDRILVGAYWGAKYDVFPKDGTTRAAPNNVQYTTADFPAILTDLKLGIDAVFDNAAQNQAKATAAGLGFGGYEFGIERAFTDLTVATSWYESQQAYDATMYACQQWEKRFGATAYANWFVETGAVANEGNTGRSLQRYLGDTMGVGTGKSAKGQALIDYNSGKRVPFTLTGTITAAANADDGSSAGTLKGVNVGSTLTITSGGTGLAVDNSGNVTVANHTLLTAGSFSMTVRDTNPGYPAPGYLDSVISYTITPALPSDNFNNGTTLNAQWTSGNTLDGKHLAAHNMTVSQGSGQLTITSTGTTPNSGGIMLSTDTDLTQLPTHYVKFISNSSNYQMLTYGVPSGDTIQIRIGDPVIQMVKCISGAGAVMSSLTPPAFPFYARFRYDTPTDKLFLGTCPGTSDPRVNANWTEATGVARPASIPTTGRLGLLRSAEFGDTIGDASVFDNFNTAA